MSDWSQIIIFVFAVHIIKKILNRVFLTTIKTYIAVQSVSCIRKSSNIIHLKHITKRVNLYCCSVMDITAGTY